LLQRSTEALEGLIQDGIRQGEALERMLNESPYVPYMPDTDMPGGLFGFSWLEITIGLLAIGVILAVVGGIFTNGKGE